MGLPASGRHYRGELPKPAVGSAGRWPANTETFRRHRVAGQRPALPGRELSKPAVGRAGRWPADTETFRRHGVAGQRPALPCGELPKPAVGRAGRWPADTETFRRHEVAGQRPALPCGNCRSRRLVVPAAGRQICKRSDVMRLPASGRHYPCGELPKPVVGSAGRWPADTETFRRHGVAGQRPALPCEELPKPVVGSAGRWPADAQTFRRHEVAGQRPALPVWGIAEA